MVWYSYLFKNFPQFVVIHTVKGFGTVNKAEIDVFLELFCFFNDPTDVDNLISGYSAFSKSSLNIWKFTFQLLLKLLDLYKWNYIVYTIFCLFIIQYIHQSGVFFFFLAYEYQ